MSGLAAKPALVAQFSQHGIDLRGLYVPPGTYERTGRFGRMFPTLEPRPDVAPAPEQLGRAGGPMDAGPTVQFSRRISAGFTFVGQFLDHDITLDTTSDLERSNDPGAVQNFRTAAFELDSVYGSGPADSPYLYDKTASGKLLLGPDGVDLPRNSQGTAIIGDPRNDENLILSQLQLAFLRFHNAAVDLVGDFKEAQRLVRWHYQWMILNEYLPLTVGEGMVSDILRNGLKNYQLRGGGDPYIPVEFSVAAFRFGHTQVRQNYTINGAFSAVLFPEDPNAPPGDDLRGGRPVTIDESPSRVMDWSNFFKTQANKDPQPASKIDTKLPTTLLRLPTSVVGDEAPDSPRRSLAVRNLKRSQAMGLPSGQNCSNKMGMKPMDCNDLWSGVSGVDEKAPAPLWYYILKEAEVKCKGETLGEMGGRIVAEVFTGLLLGDPQSYLSRNPGWTPEFPAQEPGEFKMADLLRMAGVA